ncbi:MAG: DNA translocase FtsK [Gammaproteobacteria bacterium]|nr:DNA translocase FtsK [Gammaproteobacteria bacterium]
MAERRLTVTQLKHAVLDPQWRARWLAGGQPPTLTFPPPGSGPPVKGALFHRLAEDFTHWLCHGRARKTAQGLATAEALWHEFYRRFAEARLGELAEAGQVESAHHLSACLRVFCTRLAELRATIEGFSHWQDLFLGEELAVDCTDIAGTGLCVSGRVDAVRRDPSHGVVVVDYKLSRGAETKHDLVQLAIYGHLLEASRPGLDFTGLLEYYEPELTVLEVSPADLRDLFGQMVLPVAAELGRPPPGHSPAPEPAPATPVPDTPVPDTPAADAAGGETDHSARIAETFAAFRLAVDVMGRTSAPQLVRYRVRPAAGVKVVSLANRAEDLQVSLALPSPPRIEPARGYVTIDVPKAVPDTVLWRDIQAAPELADHPSRVAFPIGLGVEGTPLMADFADPKTCHMLVAGTSGSGKSEFLRSMAASLLQRNAPASLNLTLIDPKILSFRDLEGCPHLTGPVISNPGDAVAGLEQAVKDMDQRYRRLADEGYSNLGERIATGHTDLPFHVMVFDEFADLILAGRQEKAVFESLVARLAAKGRAAGIHLVLATQRPDKGIVTGTIKANLPLRVCLKVTSAVNSQIILDEPGGEALVGRGDLLCDRGHGIERAQSAFLPAADMRRLVATLQA